MTTHTLLIPCETFSVEAIFAASETLTTLEKLVLRAMHEGMNNVEDLNDLFGIGSRPMLQLLLDLLDRSLVSFDFSRGEVHLSPDVRRKIEAKALDTIEPIDRTAQTVNLMRDLVSGSILVQRSRPPFKQAIRLYARKEANSIDAIETADVALAIRSEVHRRLTHAKRPLHVLEIAFDRKKIRGELRDLQVAVHVSLDPATDRLILQVTGPDDLPARNRAQIEQTLNVLANAHEPDAALKNLRDHATASTATRPTLKGRFQKLRESVQDLKVADRGTWNARHAALVTLTAAIEEAVLRQHVRTVRPTFMTDPAMLARAINELIAGAKRQVVMSSPSAQYAATMQFREAIERSLAAGRKFFLLFGRGDGAPELENNVRNWLHRQTENHPEQFFFEDEVSARCNGRFVIADGADVLVTSRDFLNYVGEGGVTAAVRLTATLPEQDGRRPVLRFATDLLQIAKDIFPNVSASQELVAAPYRLGIVPQPVASRLPTPQLSDAAGDIELERARVALWQRQWERRASELQGSAEQITTTFELLRDDEHLEVLYSAFRSAERSIFIGTDTIADKAVHHEFVDELTACLNRRVIVTISYRKWGPQARTELEHIASESGALRLEQWRASGSAPRLLICDDWMVVGSFDFGAAPVRRTGAERFRAATEIGLRVDGAQAVEALCTSFAPAVPTLAKWRAPVAPRTAAAPEPVAGREIGKLLDQFATAPKKGGPVAAARYKGEVLDSWFRETPSSASAFGELRELAAIEAPFLDQAIASCLHARRDMASGEGAQWLEHLVTRRWRVRDYPGVVLLMGALREHRSAFVPPWPISLLAARVSAGLATEDMFEVLACDNPDTDMATALAALAIPLVVFDPNGPAHALPVLHDVLPQPLRNWTEATTAFRAQHPIGVSRARVHALAARLSGADRRAQAQKSLETALRQFLGTQSSYKLLTLIWSRLTGGPFGLRKLSQAAEAGDLKFIREFVTQHLAGADAVVQETIAGIVERDEWYGDTEIFATRRQRLVRELDTIIESARAWLDDTPPGAAKKDSIEDHLADLSRRLKADAAGVAALEHGPSYAATLVADLRVQLNDIVELHR